MKTIPKRTMMFIITAVALLLFTLICILASKGSNGVSGRVAKEVDVYVQRVAKEYGLENVSIAYIKEWDDITDYGLGLHDTLQLWLESPEFANMSHSEIYNFCGDLQESIKLQIKGNSGYPLVLHHGEVYLYPDFVDIESPMPYYKANGVNNEVVYDAATNGKYGAITSYRVDTGAVIPELDYDYEAPEMPVSGDCTICGKDATEKFQNSLYCDEHYLDAVKWALDNLADD